MNMGVDCFSSDLGFFLVTGSKHTIFTRSFVSLPNQNLPQPVPPAVASRHKAHSLSM